MQSQAWQDGYKAGRADRFLGFRSTFAWSGCDSLNAYEREYSQGYRSAFLDLSYF